MSLQQLLPKPNAGLTITIRPLILPLRQSMNNGARQKSRDKSSANSLT